MLIIDKMNAREQVSLYKNKLHLGGHNTFRVDTFSWYRRSMTITQLLDIIKTQQVRTSEIIFSFS